VSFEIVQPFSAFFNSPAVVELRAARRHGPR